jgi:16S rRNA processing protein RimM
LKSSSKRDDRIQIGKIVAAHGIRGVVKVYSYAESAQCYTAEGTIALIDPDGAEQRYKVLWAKPHKNSLRLALDGVTTRTDAEALVGCTLWISRASLPTLDEDTYYWVDLIGMAVHGQDDEYLGRIADIIETGANDVYVVETPKGYPVKEILLPAIASVVIEVDIPGRRMSVVLPEGLV